MLSTWYFNLKTTTKVICNYLSSEKINCFHLIFRISCAKMFSLDDFTSSILNFFSVIWGKIICYWHFLVKVKVAIFFLDLFVKDASIDSNFHGTHLTISGEESSDLPIFIFSCGGQFIQVKFVGKNLGFFLCHQTHCAFVHIPTPTLGVLTPSLL